MENFWKAIRLSLRYRWTLTASIVCALAVGFLWMANIGALYPFIEATFQGKSIPDMVDGLIEEGNEQILVLNQRIAELEQQGGAETDRTLRDARAELEMEQTSVARYEAVAPWLRSYAPRTPATTLALLCALLMTGTAIKGVFIVCQCVFAARLSEMGALDLRRRFFDHSLRMDVGSFSREGAADMMSRFTNDMNNLAMGTNILFGKMVREPLKMLACLIVAACISWQLLLLTLVLLPAAGLAIRWLAKMLKRANRRAMEEMATIFTTLEEAFFSIAIIQAFTMEKERRGRFRDAAKTYYQKAMKAAKYDGMAHPLTELFGVAMICLSLSAGAYLVLSGSTTLLGIPMAAEPLAASQLILFYAMLVGAADPARKLSGLFNQVQRAVAASDRIYEMLEREPAVKEPEQPRELPAHRRDIAFEDVAFAYHEGQQEVLHDVSLKVKFGETIALVGSSGCGKSTLTKLLLRFADPTRGEVRIDGVPINETRLAELRRQIGYVPQEPILFNDTVANNIRFGNPEASEEQIVAAAKAAHAHEFITDKLAEGYDTLVGPKGGLLSGGQRQRIALARALVRDPAILILDEATGNVDMQSERMINAALAEFVGTRTTILITHRAGALELADRIVVMEEGRIIADGEHGELVESCPFYTQLFQLRCSA